MSQKSIWDVSSHEGPVWGAGKAEEAGAPAAVTLLVWGVDEVGFVVALVLGNDDSVAFVVAAGVRGVALV